MSNKIDSFKGEFAFLSNFFPANIVMEDGIWYPTTEHAFQAFKTLDMADRERIAKLATPGKSKRAGREVVLRNDWELVKMDVMRECIRRKFSHGSELAQKLIATGDAELIEGNNHGDRIWGVCDGEGKNLLGILLMEQRATLKSV